jgi:putative tryptophan/tyrosine transport system substrate-binding protein
MRRREFIGSLAGAALLGARTARAQAPGKTYRLGTFHPVAPMTEASPFGKMIVRVLSQHGYVLGQNLTFDARSSLGDNSKIPAVLQELKARNVDAIMIVGFPAALAAKSIGVPIIGANGLGDPVATGLIESSAHPGGNITGISDVAALLTTKRLSLLKQLSPKLHRVAMLWNKDDLGMTLRYQASADVAQSIGIEVQAVGVRFQRGLWHDGP